MTKKNNPFDAIFDSLLTIIDYEFEGSDVSEDELELAKSRFRSALCYIIDSEIERKNYDKQ